MKKLFTIILMACYMVSAIGTSFSIHYCGDHFRYVTFSEDTEKGCCGKNEHKTRCCTDKIVKIKIKDNHSSQVKSIIGNFWVDQVAAPITHTLPKLIFYCGEREICVSTDSSPPFERPIPIYLENRVFLI